MTDFIPDVVDLKVSLSDRIHNEIKLRIADYRFPAIAYKQGLRSTQQNAAVKAAAILVRAQQVGFQSAHTSLCGGPTQERTTWIWIALVHFDKQVNLDGFEEVLLRNPIVISRDEELDQQINVSLLDAEYQHPPEQESSNGTRVTYRFQADLSPL